MPLRPAFDRAGDPAIVHRCGFPIPGGNAFIGSEVCRVLCEAGHAVTALAREPGALPPAYDRLYRIWFACGFPAFFAVLAVFWLMLAKPAIALFN